MRRHRYLLLAPLLAGAGCASLAVDAMVPTLQQLAAVGYEQTDLEFMAHALPPNLLQLEGMLRLSPDNPQLLLLTAQGYCGYGLGFVEDEDPERAARYYWLGKERALRALAEVSDAYAEARAAGKPIRAVTREIEEEEAVAPLFWAANCWGNWLNLNLNSPRAQMAAPEIVAMMRRVLDLQPDYYYGGAYLFFATYYAMLPTLAGGGLAKARPYFDKAFEISEGKLLLVHYYFAKSYAAKLKDLPDPVSGKRGIELFDEMLAKIASADVDAVPELALVNTIAKRKAALLEAQRDRIF